MMGVSTSTKEMNKTLYKFERHSTKKVYFPEYSREFANQEGPGPQIYKLEGLNLNYANDKKPKMGIFGRVSIFQIHIFIGRQKDAISIER